MLIMLSVTPGFAQDLTHAEQVFREKFDTVNGTFVLYDLEENSYYYFNEERAGKRYPPMSTYKIPHSLVAMETGVIEGPETVLDWDSIQVPCQPQWDFYPATEWCRNHTLASAFKYSVVWFYQEVARRIGPDRMQSYVQKINYGNNDTKAAIDNFWFWRLKISASEQVEFLRKLYLEDIDFNPDYIAIVKDIMVLEDTENYVLYGKTGGGEIGENLAIGWFVGYVETEANVFFFAQNMDGRDFTAIRELRVHIVEDILTALGIIDKQAKYTGY
jgi:beta-lactamase class D